MKHLLLKLDLLLLAILLPATATASPITLQQAQQNVLSFLESKGKSISSSSLRQAQFRSTSSVTESYYVFNIGSNEGYVIAAGDDCAPAILGYADAGYIDVDSMPVNLQSWLEEYAQQIQFMQENGFASLKVPKLASSYALIPPLMTTTWDQLDPYNQNCPDFFSNGKCVTGCVATAMAQVMYYHRANSVTQTTAQIPAYDCRTLWLNGSDTLGHIHVDAIPAGSPIDWNNMLDSYSGSSTTAQQQAVANLMKYCGASVEMNYANAWSGGSGAYSTDVPTALKAYFNYSSETVLKNRSDYSSNDAWENLIYNELSNSRPVYYSGRNSSGGHAFVCDGYDGSGYYHINWGWSGSSDGYFLLTALDPDQQGTGGSSSGYNQNQAALINAAPKSSSPTNPILVTSISLNKTSAELNTGETLQLTATVLPSNATNKAVTWTTSNSSVATVSSTGLVTAKAVGNATITARTTDGSNLSGSCYITVKQNTVLATSISLNKTSAELTEGNTMQLTATVLPSNATNKTVTWTTSNSSVATVSSNGLVTAKATGSATITANTTDGTGLSAYCSVTVKQNTQNNIISFADANVKALCVRNWDTNGDGELSTSEAAAVTSLGKVFFNNESITSFDELQYFTGLTSIGDNAFYGCSGLTSITIPSSVTSIGYNAFYGCTRLTSVNIPNSVTSIGSSAFMGTAWYENQSDGLVYAGLVAYKYKGMMPEATSITVKQGTLGIAGSAFLGCSGLTTIAIPNSVTSIGEYAFSGCSGLTGVFISDLAAWCRIRFQDNEDDEEEGQKIYYNDCYNNPLSFAHRLYLNGIEVTDLVIPNSITTIKKYAFIGFSGLKKVIIPNSVDEIEYSAFMNCIGLTSVTFSNSVTSISSGAFLNCNALKNIKIPDSVIYIDKYAFCYCDSLEIVTIGSSVTGIGEWAFQGCTALKILNYNAVSCQDFDHIDQGASLIYSKLAPFYNLNITTINFGENVQRIPAYFAYSLTKLSNVTIPNSVTEIGSKAFLDCSNINNVTMSNTLASIGFQAFGRCNGLASVTIPNSVTIIGNYAFYQCNGLTNLTIGNSVTSIGDYAFQKCPALETLNFNATLCTDFSSANESPFCNLNISTINIGDNVQKIPAYFAYRQRQLANITIGVSVDTVGKYAFYECSKLTNLTFGNSVSSIGESAFYGCSQLTSVNIPNSVLSIGKNSFYNCNGLTSLYVGSSVNTVGGSAFFGCNGLARVCINNLTSWCNIVFADYASNPLYYAHHLFLNDKEVNDLAIPNTVTTINDYAFENCLSLTSVNIPQTVTHIGNYAFNSCSNLAGSLTIPKSVVSIGERTFNNDSFIETITCAAETPPSWNNMAMFTTNVYNHSPLYVPLGSERAYMADQCWGQFASIIGIEIHDDILATGISLNQSQLTMLAGGTSQLIATVLPDSTTNKVVTWISSNPDIATVDTTGLVTAIAPGSATITAITTDGSNLSASCAVTVTENLSDYDNYLSMEDVEAFHGDTLVIPVKMTNEASIISFQTDIFLPEGLELLQEDGEYLIDPSERMTRTHSIMSNAVASGAIRVLCYSSNYKPFTGNSGDDLFYITVKVADNAEGDYTIQLKNTLLTNTDFVDLAAPDVAANVNVKAYLLGDANNSGTVSITDVVVTAQYVLELNPQPFVFEAADANVDGNITVADVSRIAWMVLNPTLNAPLRTPALWNNVDRMSAEDITLAAGEIRKISILLDNEMDYSAFQLDLNLPEGLTASNFQLTDRADSHAFDVNTLHNGNIRALCYSPALTAIDGHEGALLTFDVTAVGDVNGNITVDGIELVTANCQSVKLDAFTIGVNNTTSVNESITGKAIAQVEYFNLAGQRMEQPSAGVTLIVTTYTDGSRTTTKIIK